MKNDPKTAATPPARRLPQPGPGPALLFIYAVRPFALLWGFRRERQERAGER